MVKENHTYQIISVILLIAVIAFAGLYFTKSAPASQEINEQTCSDFINECPEQMPMVDAQIYQWAENLYNSDEMFFNYWAYNYGDEEAKNVKVRCDVYDSTGTILKFTGVHNPGNLASRSASFEEFVTNNIVTSPGEEFIPLCHIESCDNCEILYKRIPDLVESYEG